MEHTETPLVSFPEYWDGEGFYCYNVPGQALPSILVPECHKAQMARQAEYDAKRRQERPKGPNYTAEDLDRQCSDMEYNNSWYRND